MSDVQLKHTKHIGISFGVDGEDLVAVVTPEAINAVRVGADATKLGSGSAPASHVLGADGNGGTEWVPQTGSGGGSFDTLQDTPSSYVGAAGKFVVVKASEDGLEFVASTGGGSSVAWGDVSGKPATYPPSAHTHSADDVDSGVLAAARGGTGIGSYTASNYLRAATATSLEERTPSQVLDDIDAQLRFRRISVAASSGTVSVDMASNPYTEATVNLTGSVTVNPTNVPLGRVILTLFVKQDGTGGHGITYPSGSVFLNGSDGTINDAANSLTIVTLVRANSTDPWHISVSDTRPLDGGSIKLEPIIMNPKANDGYEIVIWEAMTLNLGGVLTRGTGSASYSKSTNGTTFSSVSGSTSFATNDVLRVTVSSIGSWYSLTIPRTA